MINTSIYIYPTKDVWIIPKFTTEKVQYIDLGSYIENGLHINLMQISEIQFLKINSDVTHFKNYALIAPKGSTAISYKFEHYDNDKFIREKKTLFFKNGANCEIFNEIKTNIDAFLNQSIDILKTWEKVEIFRKR